MPAERAPVPRRPRPRASRQPLTVIESGIVNITGLKLSGGATKDDIETDVVNFTGGQDANEGRANVGQFVRVNITPWAGLGAGESYDPSSGLDNEELKSGEPAGQTFRHDSPDATYGVDRISLVLWKESGISTRTVTVTLRDSWTGTPLATGTVSSNSLGTSPAWVTVQFSSDVLQRASF